MQHIHRCSGCGRYTMEKACPSCNRPAVLARPPKFSLEDKYAGLRREVRKKELEERGWY